VTATADAAGNITAAVPIPASATTGTYDVSATGYSMGDAEGPTEPVAILTAATAVELDVLDITVGIFALFEADPTGYTPATYGPFVAAMARARALLAYTGPVARSAVDAALANLNAAIATLAVIPRTPNAPEAPADQQPKANAQADPTAKAAVIVRVKAGQTRVTLRKGQSITLAAYAYSGLGKSSKVTWKSSRPKVAKVAKTGKITAVKTGRATVAVKSANGESSKIAVRVVAKGVKAVAKVSATGVPKTMSLGTTKAITGKYTPSKIRVQ